MLVYGSRAKTRWSSLVIRPRTISMTMVISTARTVKNCTALDGALSVRFLRMQKHLLNV